MPLAWLQKQIITQKLVRLETKLTTQVVNDKKKSMIKLVQIVQIFYYLKAGLNKKKM